MLWVSHGVSEQNSRRAAHMAQPGSLTPLAIHTLCWWEPSPAWPCRAELVGTALHPTLDHSLLPCPSLLQGNGVPVARLTQAFEKDYSNRGGRVLMELSGFWCPTSGIWALWATAVSSMQHSTTWHRNARFLELLYYAQHKNAQSVAVQATLTN